MSQNLLVNGDFEIIDTLEIFPGFSNANNYQAAEIQRHCCPGYFHKKAPLNFHKSIAPQRGDAFMGFGAWFYSPVKKRSSQGEYRREYIGISIVRPLQIDSVYRFSIHYRYGIGIFNCNGLDVAFTTMLQLEDSVGCHKPLTIVPYYSQSPNSIKRSYSEWVELTFDYRAKGNEQFVVLGNFKHDKQTKLKRTNIKRHEVNQFCYCLIDNASLIPLYSTASQLHDTVDSVTSTSKTGLSELECILMETTVLFGTGSAIVDGHDYNQIEDIASVYLNFPGSRIVVTGNTDVFGMDSLNLELSKKRALAVRTILLELGIPDESMQINALGSSRATEVNPITSEESVTDRSVIINLYCP